MMIKSMLRTKETVSNFITEEEKISPIHFLSDQKEIVTDFINIGFDELEAITYLALLQIGPITIGNLSVKIGMDRGKIYRSLTKLKNYGLVNTTFSNPAVVTAIEPKIALNSVLDKKRDELSSVQKLSEKIITNLKSSRMNINTTEASSFSILQGRSIIYSRIGKIIENSESNLIYIVATVNDLAKMYYTSLPEKLLRAKQNGTIVRIITEYKPTKIISEILKRFNANEIKVGTLPSKGRIIVEQERQLVMSESSFDSTDSGNSDVALHTNSFEFVQNMFHLCEYLWNNSSEFVEI